MLCWRVGKDRATVDCNRLPGDVAVAHEQQDCLRNLISSSRERIPESVPVGTLCVVTVDERYRAPGSPDRHRGFPPFARARAGDIDHRKGGEETDEAGDGIGRTRSRGYARRTASTHALRGLIETAVRLARGPVDPTPPSVSRNAPWSCSPSTSTTLTISFSRRDLTEFFRKAIPMTRRFPILQRRKICVQLDASEDGTNIGVDRLFFVLNGHHESQWITLPRRRSRLASGDRHEPSERRGLSRSRSGGRNGEGRERQTTERVLAFTSRRELERVATPRRETASISRFSGSTVVGSEHRTS
jgi:hypothetical protein